MIPIDQTVFGPRGNCKAACIASVLELPLAAVPECDGGVWVQRHTDWLAAFNLTLLHIPARGGSFYVPGCHLLIAKSLRNEGYHCVVVRDGEIVHDPHPERAMGVGLWLTYGLFVALDPRHCGTPVAQPLDGRSEGFSGGKQGTHTRF